MNIDISQKVSLMLKPSVMSKGLSGLPKKVPLRQPNRSRYEIVNDILYIISNGQTTIDEHQISIRYAAHLLHSQTSSYLKGLIEEGLITLTRPKPYPLYEMTPKGWRYLKVYAEIEDDLEPLTKD